MSTLTTRIHISSWEHALLADSHIYTHTCYYALTLHLSYTGDSGASTLVGIGHVDCTLARALLTPSGSPNNSHTLLYTVTLSCTVSLPCTRTASVPPLVLERLLRLHSLVSSLRCTTLIKRTNITHCTGLSSHPLPTLILRARSCTAKDSSET